MDLYYTSSRNRGPTDKARNDAKQRDYAPAPKTQARWPKRRWRRRATMRTNQRRAPAAPSSPPFQVLRVQTNFSPDQLADVHIAEADKILKSCQHYGFCTSGCPTYVLLHDENDSPRGRIDLIKEMLESGAPPKPQTVTHLDRCLSCMSCMTTCAVQVDYMHLIDTARVHIEKTYARPRHLRMAGRHGPARTGHTASPARDLPRCLLAAQRPDGDGRTARLAQECSHLIDSPRSLG